MWAEEIVVSFKRQTGRVMGSFQNDVDKTKRTAVQPLFHVRRSTWSNLGPVTSCNFN